MRRLQRIVLLATLAVTAPVLAGCADFDVDKLDIFHLTDKKKLPGDRQPLFPEGVPGVTQGIPQEYMKGNQPPPETALGAPVAPVDGAPAAEAKTQAAPPAEEPKAKPKPKPKKTAKRTAPKPQAAPVQPVTQQAAPAPWPASAQGEASGNSNTAPWPSAPPPGTFSR